MQMPNLDAYKKTIAREVAIAANRTVFNQQPSKLDIVRTLVRMPEDIIAAGNSLRTILQEARSDLSEHDCDELKKYAEEKLHQAATRQPRT
jgi:hypothetical protein